MCAGNESGWTILLALSCAPAVAALLMYRWIPESPHFLFAKGKSDEAVQGEHYFISSDINLTNFNLNCKCFVP